MSTELENIILIRKHLSNISIETWGFKGIFRFISDADLLALKALRVYIRDCYYVSNNDDVNFEDIQGGIEIYLALDTSNILNYYETFNSFLNANKYQIEFKVFYIHEFEYLHDTSPSVDIIEKYLLNLNIIEFTKNISDYTRIVAGELELFFYKSEKGLELKIDYDNSLLGSIKTADFHVLEELKLEFTEKTDAKERKQLFINELINLLQQKGNVYKNYIINWNGLIENYKKSFSLYLTGFSFEKVKSSSIEHFHELTDRIHSTILKFSAYIFGVPVSYILVIRFLSFDGSEFGKDTLLAFLSILFFILIWYILFKTIDDAINAIKKDIVSFKDKTGNDKGLDEIRKALDNQYEKIIPKQEKKLVLAKAISILALLVVFNAYIIIYSKPLREQCDGLKKWVIEKINLKENKIKSDGIEVDS